MASFEGRDGGDYVVFSTGKGQLFVFEAYDGESGNGSPRSFFHCRTKIVRVWFDSVRNAVIGVGEDGDIFIVEGTRMKIYS